MSDAAKEIKTPPPAETQTSESHIRRLGEVLVARGFVSDVDLEKALEKAKEKGMLLGNYLVQEGFLTERELVPILSEVFGGRVLGTKKKKLGQVLVDRGLMTVEQVTDALDQAQKRGLRLGKVLVDDKLISDLQLAQALCEVFSMEFLNLDGVTPSEQAVSIVTEKIAKQYCVLPIQIDKGILTIATNDPLNIANFETVRQLIKMQFKVVISPESQLRAAIQKTYSKLESIQGLVKYLTDKRQEQKKVVPDLKVTATPMGTSPNVSVELLINMLIQDAIKEGASDIHLEPTDENVRVRIRVDGILRESNVLTLSLHPVIISRIKVLAQLDIAKKREPQDGHFQFPVGGEPVDIRVSTMPVTKGEKIVLRILDKSQVRAELESVGLDEWGYQKVSGLLKKPHGILLVTGPTGSGKSTSVYSMINHIKGVEKNIVTLEDPVEYEFDLINQIQISEKSGLSFATMLRAVLRQDPDVIMVGEIRDGETAEIAVRAALTGHLVISTLHTNGAVPTVSRLIEMGIEPFFVSGSLLGIVAQRLVRKLCQKCKAPHVLTEADVLLLQDPGLKVGMQAFKAVGCDTCRHQGYSGREAIFEILVPTPEIRIAISQKRSEAELQKLLEKTDYRTMKSDGVRKILAGITTIQEVIRVVD